MTSKPYNSSRSVNATACFPVCYEALRLRSEHIKQHQLMKLLRHALSHYVPLIRLQCDDKGYERRKKGRRKDVCGVFLVSVGALGVAERKRSYSIEDDVFGSDTKARAFEDVSRAPASVWGRWINMNWWKQSSQWHVKCGMLFIVEGWCWRAKHVLLFLLGEVNPRRVNPKNLL